MKNVFLIIFLSFFTQLQAQKTEPKEFSYTNDRLILKSTDLYGHTFLPYKGRLQGTRYDSPLKLGAVMFRITSSTVEVRENIRFTMNGSQEAENRFNFSVSSIHADKKGLVHEFVLRDLRVADALSSLKIILNEKAEPIEIHFAPVGETARVYLISSLPADIAKRDNSYYTHEGDFSLTTPDVLWGQTLVPFALLENLGDYQIYQRIYPGEALTLKFEERTVQKGKKEKLQQYVLLSSNDNGTIKTQEWLIRKYKEVPDKNPKSELKHLLFQLKNEATDTEVDLLITRRGQGIKSLDIGNLSYLMRSGKRQE